MDLYSGWSKEGAKIIKSSIDRGDSAFEANRKLTFKKTDIEGSMTNMYNTADGNGILNRISYKPPMVETMRHAYYDATPKLHGRDLSVLNNIKGSKVKEHPHHSFKSNFMPVDY